jgi:galactokinase
MDQGCAFGNHPVLMVFDGDRLETNELQVEKELHFVIVDLGAQKDTMEILNRLNRCYPFAENEIERGVQELLGPINKRVTQQAVDVLRVSDGENLGRLMVEAQAFFDRYATPACPEELTAPVLHRVLNHEPLKPHIWGGKGVGSQGDGTAQFITRSQADQQAVIEILERDLGVECLELTLRPGGGRSPL